MKERSKMKTIVASKIRQLHMGRCLQIKHLPTDVSKEEVSRLLCDIPVKSIKLIYDEPRSSTAWVEPENPEVLEEWDENRVFLLHNQPIFISPCTTNRLLCVAYLPPDYSEEQFLALVQKYGKVERSFLMISEKTWNSKGYGFVEYKLIQDSFRAKRELDKKHVRDHILVCDWLDSYPKKFESLHSKCLYVDCFPNLYRDIGEFRNIFSSVAKPVYCLIALDKMCPQDWGLVEYRSWQDAEASLTALNKYNLKGHNIRVQYCIPGTPAHLLYSKILKNSQPKTSKGLLPVPTSSTVLSSVLKNQQEAPSGAEVLPCSPALFMAIPSPPSQQSSFKLPQQSSSLPPPPHINNGSPSPNILGPLLRPLLSIPSQPLSLYHPNFTMGWTSGQGQHTGAQPTFPGHSLVSPNHHYYTPSPPQMLYFQQEYQYAGNSFSQSIVTSSVVNVGGMRSSLQTYSYASLQFPPPSYQNFRTPLQSQENFLIQTQAGFYRQPISTNDPQTNQQMASIGLRKKKLPPSENNNSGFNVLLNSGVKKRKN